MAILFVMFQNFADHLEGPICMLKYDNYPDTGGFIFAQNRIVSKAYRHCFHQQIQNLPINP